MTRVASTCAATLMCGLIGVAFAGNQSADTPSSESAATGQTRTDGASGRMSMSKSLTDQSFVTQAAQGGMAEIDLSNLALQKSQDSQIRSFAQRMVQDHGKANSELKPIAQKLGLQVPSDTDAKHKQEMQKLGEESGAKFDAAYSKAMEKDHTKAVELFTKASKSDTLKPDLRNFAAKTLPVLETHHQMADNLPKSSMRSAQSSNSQPRSQ